VVYKSEKLAKEANNQVELRMDVQRLYALSTELKDEVDRANSDTTLSVTVLKRTQDIEKLAKQIRDRAKR
jgi:spore coat polysaccharide biosynthesis protein SpsF (cytidylyltransferase family)